MKKREFIRLTQNTEFYSLPEFSYYVHHNVKDAPICTSEGRNIKEHESYSTAVNIYSCDDGIVGVEGVYERFNECSENVKMRQTMDEEIKLNEYQKSIVKAAAANTLMSKLRDVARCINETKNVFDLFDPDFDSSEISKKMIYTDDKVFDLAQEMSLIYTRIVNSETLTDEGE